MADPFIISPSGWAILDLLHQQSGISFEVLHLWLHPVRAITRAEHGSAVDETGVAEQVLKSVRTGEVRIDQGRNLTFGAFPLRKSREVVACLVAFRRASSPDGLPLPEEGRVVEEVGALARAVLESDLALSAQVATGEATTRRLHGILRFLGQLGGFENDQEIMKALLHAATVWFDLDCRIYQRQVDGSFALAAALPALDQPGGGLRLEPSRAVELLAARRYSSAGDLEDLGLAGRRDEVLALPVGALEPEWIVILAGAIDVSAELAFSAITRILTGEVQIRRFAEIDRWQRRLADIPREGHRAPERVVLTMLGDLLREVGAASGRLSVSSQTAVRVIASVGQMPNDRPSSQRLQEPATGVVTTFDLSPEVSATLELSGVSARSLGGAARAWIKALSPWLSQAFGERSNEAARFDRMVEAASFERRIQEEIERAKRFNLGLGLVLIGPAPLDGSAGPSTLLEELSATVRPELRASDLLGRVRGGLVAALLVHAGPEGAESVTSRLRSRLSDLPSEAGAEPLHLGQAVFAPDCATADDLIARALRHAQALSVRH